MIQIYDSLTRKKRPFLPLRPGQVSLYVCGVTPYAAAHVGHARPAVMWDVIKRYFVRRGYIVRHVQNFTDIDDKIVHQAQVDGISTDALAENFMKQYQAVMEQLQVLPPDYAARVTENISAIIAFVQDLIDQRAAYVSGGDVYFSVSGDREYGGLSGRRVDELYEGVRVEVHAGKREAADFALWKGAEPAEVGWESPWGHGRPGWHIECSAMAGRYLGPQFDLHGGGIDLIFPHHENERAQSQAHYHCEPAQFWVHNGLITQSGVKMSKSLGNGLGLEDLLQRLDPVVLRTYLLSVHYRTPLDFQIEAAQEWGRGLARVWRLWEEVCDAPAPSEWVDEPWSRSLEQFESRLLESLDDDFNTAKAFADVFDMVHTVNQGMERGHAAVARGWARKNLQAADAILGMLPAPRPLPDSTLAQDLLGVREHARLHRDFQEADQIREFFTKAGYTIEDTPEGPRILSGPQRPQA